MCAEKMQRIILAIILGTNMGLAVTEPKIAFLVQLSLIILLLIGGFAGKCLSIELLRQFLPPCDVIKKDKR